MSEETPDENSDDGDTRKLRGTSSRTSPFSGESAPEEPEEEARITICAPDGSARTYKLTESVKQGYEEMVEDKISSACEWYEMWWQGTKLIIEYEGFIRDNDLRPEHEDLSREQIQQMLMKGDDPTTDGVPKRPNPGLQAGNASPRGMMDGNMPEPSVTLDLNEYVGGESETQKLDEGVIPVSNTTSIDIQKRADERPLEVEDEFLQPWNNEEPPEPVNSEHTDGEVDSETYEVDFRNMTDSKDKTVNQGARGNRWTL